MRDKATIYYKATAPDGMSFQGNPRVLYAVGETAVPIAHGKPRICGPGYLHASDEPGETLIGGSWPCRLFEVSGTPVVGFDSEHKHKGGFLSLYVEREIEAHRALGPNGVQVAAFIARCAAATNDEWRIVIDAAWDAAWDAARDAARGAARDAAWDAAWGAARDAAWDAALALIVRDKITPKQFDLLYAHVGRIIPADSLVTT